MSYSSNITAILNEAERKAQLAVQKTALDIEAGAKARTPPRVDTGAMMNGWNAEEIGPLEWEVGNPIEYAIHHEFGTVHMGAHPMLIPATEDARPGFEAAIRQAYQ